MFTRFKRVLKNFFESDDCFGMLDLLIVVAIVIVIGMLQVRDAIAGPTDSYHIKQTVSGQTANHTVQTRRLQND